VALPGAILFSENRARLEARDGDGISEPLGLQIPPAVGRSSVREIVVDLGDSSERSPIRRASFSGYKYDASNGDQHRRGSALEIDNARGARGGRPREKEAGKGRMEGSHLSASLVSLRSS